MTAQLADAPVVATIDHSALTHMVNCPEDKASTEAWLTEARVFGLTVTALCGHQWVPTRDPLRHPICQACVEAANIIIAESSDS